MRRREFITLLGGAATWPVAASAQQPAMPVVGFLGTSSPDAAGLRAFHLGLKETGYVEGDNVTILHRWTAGRLDQLPEAAADPARRRVAVIASFGNAPAVAAKAVTMTIPIVFGVSEDPVRIGLVDSFARPGGNVTGFNYLSAELAAKRLELLLELMPGAKSLAVLVDPVVPPTQTTLQDVTAAASTMGLRIRTLNASNSSEINAAFATLAQERPSLPPVQEFVAGAARPPPRVVPASWIDDTRREAGHGASTVLRLFREVHYTSSGSCM
jgi:ABC-type uncharacterized transport system substrate-binding protein